MFDPEELNSKINQSFKNQEKVEAEAQGLEKKLLENYEFKKSMIKDFSIPCIDQPKRSPALIC